MCTSLTESEPESKFNTEPLPHACVLISEWERNAIPDLNSNHWWVFVFVKCYCAWSWQTPPLLFMTPQCRFNYAHCTDEKMEALRNYAICPALCSEKMAELRLEPASGWCRCLGLQPPVFLLLLFYITQDINIVYFVEGDDNSFFYSSSLNFSTEYSVQHPWTMMGQNN